CSTFITADHCGQKALRSITLDVTLPALGDVGYLSDVRILGQYCTGRFKDILDEHSHELRTLGVDVFYNLRRVWPWLCEQGRRKGTGCCQGREINSRTLIYISNVSNENHRGYGVGSWMMGELVDSRHVQKVIMSYVGHPPLALRTRPNRPRSRTI
ncbi:hypothetical protein Hypma_002887, partial [Hypsizygus marmoreus]